MTVLVDKNAEAVILLRIDRQVLDIVDTAGKRLFPYLTVAVGKECGAIKHMQYAVFHEGVGAIFPYEIRITVVVSAVQGPDGEDGIVAAVLRIHHILVVGLDHVVDCLLFKEWENWSELQEMLSLRMCEYCGGCPVRGEFQFDLLRLCPVDVDYFYFTGVGVAIFNCAGIGVDNNFADLWDRFELINHGAIERTVGNAFEMPVGKK